MPPHPLDAVTNHFLKQLAEKKAPPIYKLPVLQARAVLDSLQAHPIPKPSADIEDRFIPCGPDEKLSIRIIRPPHTKAKLPIILYFHGGGWILGNRETHDRLVREIAIGSNAAVIFLNYTPSPEAQYPKPLEEAYAALTYLAAHGDTLHLDPSRIAVAGDSVGGNMATVTAILSLERDGPRLAAQALFYPVTDASLSTPSYHTYAKGPWLTKPAMEWFWEAYAPNPSDRTKHTASPLHTPTSTLKHLPPTLLLTAEHDVLRDEGEAYAHKLLQAGIEVTSARYLGTIHDFLLLNPLAETPPTHSALGLACSFLKSKLHP